MFYQIFLSPQVKWCAIITSKHGIYEFPHELPNDLRLRVLGDILYQYISSPRGAHHTTPPPPPVGERPEPSSLQTGEAFTVEEYKHTHTHTHHQLHWLHWLKINNNEMKQSRWVKELFNKTQKLEPNLCRAETHLYFSSSCLKLPSKHFNVASTLSFGWYDVATW